MSDACDPGPEARWYRRAMQWLILLSVPLLPLAILYSSYALWGGAALALAEFVLSCLWWNAGRRKLLAEAPDFCMNCGYSRRGLRPGALCPECGEPYVLADMLNTLEAFGLYAKRYEVVQRLKAEEGARALDDGASRCAE